MRTQAELTSLPIDARERAELCDLLAQLGPDARTLCEGWTTADLAAHLVIRERDPRSMPGIVLGASKFANIRIARPFGRYTAKLQNKRKAKGYESSVSTLRSGPPLVPWKLPMIRPYLNLVEYFVHHEDVRRSNGLSRRTDRSDLDDALWAMLKTTTRLVAGRVKPIGLELRRLDGTTRTVRRGSPTAVLVGAPSELALYLNGRRGAADVELSGPEDAQRVVREANLGI